MGAFISSHGMKDILDAVFYVLKQVEAIGFPKNGRKSVTESLKKNIFFRFNQPRFIIIAGASHFNNKIFNSLLVKYGVCHNVDTTYHSHPSGHVEMSNRERK